MIARVLGVPILNVSLEEALDLVAGSVARRERQSVFFVNAHCVNVAARASKYGELLRGDATVFGDGIGIRIAAWLSRRPLRDNVNGTDLFPLLCRRAAEQGFALYLLGGEPGVPEEVARRMVSRYPALRIAGAHHGFFDDAVAEGLVQAINASGADVLLVGFGVPRQEEWIAAHRGRLEAPVVMGVGGLFDYYSGRIPRAPRLWRRLSMEWAWRLAMEPGRMWRRYLLGNFTFMGRVLWWILRGGARAEGSR